MKVLGVRHILSAVFLLLVISCKKEKAIISEQLPAETQIGKNSFGCLIDNILFLPRSYSESPAINASIQFNLLNIGATNGKETIVMGVYNLNQAGTYPLTGTNRAEYYLSSVKYTAIEGEIIIKKYDKVLNILAGTFWFRAKNSDGKVVSVHEGRFDLKPN